MNVLHRRRHAHAVSRYRQLRTEVMQLSAGTAAAMLTGIQSGAPVLCGQYGDRDAACPLLLAHRHGAPRQHVTAFAKAWDSFCGVSSYDQRRQASRNELWMLRLLLEERLMPRPERSTRAGRLAPRPAATPAITERQLTYA